MSSESSSSMMITDDLLEDEIKVMPGVIPLTRIATVVVLRAFFFHTQSLLCVRWRPDR